MNPMMIASILAFIGVTGVAVVVMMLLGDKKSDAMEDRLQVLTGKKAHSSSGDVTRVARDALVKDTLEDVSGAFRGIAESFSLHRKFQQAAVSLRVEAFLGIMAVFGLGGAAMAFVMRCPVMLLPVVGIVFSMLPYVWLGLKASYRMKKFGLQLSPCLELLGRALRSGHSLGSAIKLVVEDMPAPMSQEMGIAYEEQNFGVPLEQSLKNIYTRIPNLDFKFFVTAVAIQRQSGGDLAEILDKIGSIIRERYRIQGQIAALTGEGRISGIVLMALPVAIFGAVWVINREYVMLLFTDPLGKQMIAGAVCLQMAGAWCIKKIVTIEV